MSKLEKIESDLRTRSDAELEEVREWLENFLEDRLQFTDKFEAKIKRSEQAMSAGERPRIRHTPAA